MARSGSGAPRHGHQGRPRQAEQRQPFAVPRPVDDRRSQHHPRCAACLQARRPRLLAGPLALGVGREARLPRRHRGDEDAARTGAPRRDRLGDPSAAVPVRRENAACRRALVSPATCTTARAPSTRSRNAAVIVERATHDLDRRAPRGQRRRRGSMHEKPQPPPVPRERGSDMAAEEAAAPRDGGERRRPARHCAAAAIGAKSPSR